MTVTDTYFSSEGPSPRVEDLQDQAARDQQTPDLQDQAARDQQTPRSAPVSGVGSSAGVCAGFG